jgi:hypothetical protein
MTAWPGYGIDESASGARAMGWLAFLYGAKGQLYFKATHCLRTAESAQYAHGGNGDGTLFYPGDPATIGGEEWIPLESMRLKMIRDGLEDYEYLKLLADRQQTSAAMRIAKGLFPAMYASSRSDAEVQAGRRDLARHLGLVAVP